MTKSGKFNKRYIYAIIIPILIMIFRPLNFTFLQSFILASLIFTIYCWTTGLLSKIKSSCFLLVVFLILGQSSVRQVLNFPLSNNFITIIFAFLFSQGIVNANLASKFSSIILKRYGKNPISLLNIGFLMAIVMIFIIPQPFSRAILIASILKQYLHETKATDKTSETILFGSFIFATSSYLLISNGDIILNTAAMGFASLSLSKFEWLQYMFLPSILTCLFIWASFIVTFRKNLIGISLQIQSKESQEHSEWSSSNKRALLIVLIVIVLGATEFLHKIPYSYILVVATIFMYINHTLTKKDLKVVNIDLLFFLTASFSIGIVLKNTGIATLIFSELVLIFPSDFSSLYVFVIIVITMLLHMLLGSTITTLSIVIPGLLTITQGVIPATIVMFISYISVNIHYLLPFHHITIMIGAGNNYFPNKIVTRFGIVLTFIVIISIFAFYIPWWKMIGLL